MTKEANTMIRGSKKIALFIALVFLFSSVFSLVTVQKAFAGTQIHVQDVPSGVTSVSVKYNGDTIPCTKTGANWRSSDGGDYVTSGIQGVWLNGVYIPRSAFSVGTEAGGTVKIYNLPALASYTIVREYYTSTNGGAPVKDGSTSTVVNSYVGYHIDVSALPKDTTYDGKTYSYTSVSPSTDKNLTAAGLTITQRYDRCIADYTIVREYYTTTDGGTPVKDGFTSETATGIVGNTINVSSISKATSYDGKTYSYTSVSPATNQILTPAGLTITQRYDRCITTATVTVNHKYYTITDGSSNFDGQDSTSFTGIVGNNVDVSAIGRDNTYDGKTYEFKSIDPSANFTLASGGATVTLTYERILTTGTYTIVHEYYKSIDGGTPTLEATVSGGTGTGIVGTTLDLSTLTKVLTNDGKTYTHTGYDPAANPVISDGMTVKIKYTRYLTTAGYTVVHQYYTSIDGGAYGLDDTYTEHFSGYVDDVIAKSAVTQRTTNDSKTYTFVSILPDSITLDADGETFYVTYHRSLSSYKIVHEYYTSMNGGAYAKDGEDESAVMYGYVDDVIDLSGIGKDNSYGGADYTFKRFDPATNPALGVSGGLVIKLIYERDLAEYTITHSYATIINAGTPVVDGTTTAVTFTGYAGATVDLSAITQLPDFNSKSYTFVNYNYSANPAIAADGSTAIVLNYERYLADYTIVHEYYTSLNGATPTLTGTVAFVYTGTVADMIILSGITQKPDYGTGTYVFQTFDPAVDTAIAADGSTKITLTYARTVYKITTSVSNGTITETQEDIPGGALRTITYTPNKNYHLVSLTVDGVAVDITKYPNEYTFANIIDNHQIAAVFEADPGTLTISKVIAGTSTPLANAVFSIYGDAGLKTLKYSNVKTNASGIATVADIPVGNYWIVETAAPEGYQKLSISIPVTITAGENTAIVIPNTQEQGFGTGDLKIVKTDTTSGEALSGAVFSVYADSGLKTLVKSGLKTNSAGVTTLDGLDPGTYYIVETAAPSGYKKISVKIAAVVVANETTVINIKNSKTEEEDYQTGTDDYNQLIAGGMLLILGAGLIVLYMRKRQRA